MGRLSKFSPIARAVGIMGITAGLVTGVTFAAMQSTATLSDSTISAADANLKIYDSVSQAYEEDAPGFNITNLVPGQGSGENLFYLQNNSGVPVYLYVHAPHAPAAPPSGYGFTGWENLKVTIDSKETACPDASLVTDMAALLAGNVALPCNTFAAGAQGNNTVGAEGTEGNFSISFDINPTSVTPGASDVGVDDLDLQFIGSITANPAVI